MRGSQSLLQYGSVERQADSTHMPTIAVFDKNPFLKQTNKSPKGSIGSSVGTVSGENEAGELRVESSGVFLRAQVTGRAPVTGRLAISDITRSSAPAPFASRADPAMTAVRRSAVSSNRVGSPRLHGRIAASASPWVPLTWLLAPLTNVAVSPPA